MVARSDRFDSKVDRSGPHHLWLGARSAQGVGQVRVDGKLMTAPRAAWARAYGDPPPAPRCWPARTSRPACDPNTSASIDPPLRSTLDAPVAAAARSPNAPTVRGASQHQPDPTTRGIDDARSGRFVARSKTPLSGQELDLIWVDADTPLGWALHA